jgi:hypothetical protein
MKKILFFIVWIITIFNTAFAAGDAWIFEWSGIDETKLKTWDIHLDDIPGMIKSVIDWLLGISWTVAVICVIYWAYLILFGSLEWEKSKWKWAIFAALMGFALATLAWFIISFIISNLSA